MDIEKCYEILEVNKDATQEQVRQAYKDLVNIWHPDRVSNNPRLKQKAEDKLKEINTAYEIVNSHFSASNRNVRESDARAGSQPEPSAEAPPTAAQQHDDNRFQSRPDTGSESEPTIRQGEGVFSNLWSSFSALLRQIFADVPSRVDGGDADAREGPGNYGMGHGRGRRMGRGKRMGRGGGNRMGRGGRGGGRGR